jgi:hypothetical protein
MDPRHLDELKALEEHYWWHVSKRALVTELLEAYAPRTGRLVEGGIGGGGNLRHFQSLGYRVTGLEVMAEAVRHCREQGLPTCTSTTSSSRGRSTRAPRSWCCSTCSSTPTIR